MAGENEDDTVVVETTNTNTGGDPIREAAETAGAVNLPPGGDDVEESIEVLKERLAKAEQRATAAEAQVRDATGQLSSALSEVDRSNLTVINSAIERLTTDHETLKARYADAMAQGDFAGAAEINAQMITNTANLTKLENGKIALETKPRREARVAATATGDPVERKLAEWNLLGTKSADWLRKHPDFILDPRKNQRMLAAHNMVMTADDAPEVESEEYFALVEKQLGLGHSDAATSPPPPPAPVLSGAAAPTARRGEAPPPAAPANGGGGNPKRAVRLTAAEAEAARISGLTPEQYYANKQKIDREAKGQKLN